MFQAPRPLRTQPSCVALPERVDAAIARALAKDPRQRPQSALEFVRDLTGAAQPGVASPPVAPAVVRGAAPVSMEVPAPGVVRSTGPVIFAVVALLALVAAGAAWFATRSRADSEQSAASPSQAQPDASVAAARVSDAGSSTRDAGAPARDGAPSSPAPARRPSRASHNARPQGTRSSRSTH